MRHITKDLITITRISGNIRTMYLWNTSSEGQHYTSPFRNAKGKTVILAPTPGCVNVEY